VQIKQAIYGAADRSVDVTERVARLVVNGILTIPVSLNLNFLFGDPAMGTPKTLHIELADAGNAVHSYRLYEHNGHPVRHFSVGAPTRRPWPALRKPGKTVCLYAYYEKNPGYRDNLLFFLKHGLLPGIDYVFVINGECSVEFPSQPNVRVIKRPNTGFDFGGHSVGLAALDREYDYYFFLNATARGPFLPPYLNIAWTEPFTALLIESVTLVGASICIQYNFDWLPYYGERFAWDRQFYPAIESYFFALNREGLEIAVANGIFDPCDETDLWQVVFKREIALSLCMLAQGKNIDCLIPEMRGIDYRQCFANFNPSHFTPTSRSGCFGRSLHPYETVFFKQNRNICNAEVESLSAYFNRSCPEFP
jgi:hypothetical protein